MLFVTDAGFEKKYVINELYINLVSVGCELAYHFIIVTFELSVTTRTCTDGLFPKKYVHILYNVSQKSSFEVMVDRKTFLKLALVRVGIR